MAQISRLVRCGSPFALAALVCACGASTGANPDATQGGIDAVAVVDAALDAPGVDASPQCSVQQVLFHNDFESAPPAYDFIERFPLTGRIGNVEHYSETAVPLAGWDGSTASQLDAFQSHEQFQMGWYWSGLGPNGGWTWGDEIYVRFRIRFDDSFRWDGNGSQQNKMLDIGGGPNARMILHNERDRPTTPCGLKNVDYSQPGNPMYNTAEEFGLPADAFDHGDWGSLSAKNGIDYPCTPPVAVTHGVWYHVQLGVRISSAPGASDGFFKLWVNRNDPLHPSSEALDIVRELGEWNSSWGFGGYWSNMNTLRDSVWLVDDVEVATTFDCTWAPPGAEPAPTLP